MKIIDLMTFRKLIPIFIFILLCALNQEVSSQTWSGEKKNRIWRLVTINANGGALSYFGDMSKYDKDPINKLRSESGPAYGIIVTKFFYDKFGITGQLIQGNLKGSGKNQTFTTQILEFNLHARTELFKLFFPEKQFRIGISPYIGLGQFFFKSSTTITNNETITVKDVKSGVPEFVYFIGGGLSYKLPSNLSVTADFSMKQCQNDKLDNYIAFNNYDYYTYISMGVSYRINNIVKEPIKNKTRLAKNEPYHSKRKLNKGYR